MNDAFPGASIGEGVIDQNTKDLWIYQGGGDWENIGDITVQGVQGTQGVQGLQGYQGLQGNQGVQGVAAAKQLGGKFAFDNNTDLGSPGGTKGTPSGTGYFRLNNDPFSGATILSIDETDLESNSILGILQAVEEVDNPQKAIVTFSKIDDTGVFKSFFITGGSPSIPGNDFGTYRRYTVTPIDLSLIHI